MASEVVFGICDLLKQKKHKDITRYTIKACTYISMNYDFIKQSHLSLDILQAMMELLKTMNQRDDQYYIILTIKNILKGDKLNKKYFLDNGGTQKFTDIILKSNDLQLIEMCIQGIAEQSSYKKFMVSVLNNPEGTEQLKHMIKKCLNITEGWYDDSKQEIKRKTTLLTLRSQSIAQMSNASPGRKNDNSQRNPVKEETTDLS